MVSTGYGPSAQVWIGNVQATYVIDSGKLIAQVPTGPVIAPGTYPVRIVNPEGCESQEIANLQVLAQSSSCGLTGFEAFVLLGLLGLRRVKLLIA